MFPQCARVLYTCVRFDPYRKSPIAVRAEGEAGTGSRCGVTGHAVGLVIKGTLGLCVDQGFS